jgi:hypothetical protein
MGLSVRFVSNDDHVLIAPEGAPTHVAFAYEEIPLFEKEGIGGIYSPILHLTLSLDSRIASNNSFRSMFLPRPGTSNGDRRDGDFGRMENISPLRRRIMTSSFFDCSRISASF